MKLSSHLLQREFCIYRARVPLDFRGTKSPPHPAILDYSSFLESFLIRSAQTWVGQKPSVVRHYEAGYPGIARAGDPEVRLSGQAHLKGSLKILRFHQILRSKKSCPSFTLLPYFPNLPLLKDDSKGQLSSSCWQAICNYTYRIRVILRLKAFSENHKECPRRLGQRNLPNAASSCRGSFSKPGEADPK